MRRALQQTLIAAVLTALLVAAPAIAADNAASVPPPPAGVPVAPASDTTAPAPISQGDAIAPPKAAPAKKPPASAGTGGTSTGSGKKPQPAGTTKPKPAPDTAGATPAPGPVQPFSIPSIPTSTCAAVGVPPVLVPIYQRAAEAYNLGPQGPAVLAGINEVETAFGTNLNVSSAGAIGWMQFMPSTWDSYGVDANGDGVRDPYNPEDAIFAAARYLSAAGMPADTYSAIYAYNHADWYVAEVLSNAQCYGPAVAPGANSATSLEPQMPVLTCTAAPGWQKDLPHDYLAAFEGAAGRYGLGQRGVWAMAAVGRLESDFGRGMTKKQLRTTGPLGLDRSEWRHYGVDGDEDGHIRHADPSDSAATLARLIWSRGSLRAGVFTHNQASWYVDAVMNDANRMQGRCKVRSIDWAIALPQATSAPINWANLTLSNDLELHDIKTGALDPRILGLLGAITQDHQITISALRSDHSEYTVDGNVSNHYFGRAMDIASVDGVSCTDTAPNAPCANLGRTHAYQPPPAHPTELIYCFDLDGPGPAFARSDHCDHVHVGYDG
jgi:hypothetical protein